MQWAWTVWLGPRSRSHFKVKCDKITVNLVQNLRSVTQRPRPQKEIHWHKTACLAHNSFISNIVITWHIKTFKIRQNLTFILKWPCYSNICYIIGYNFIYVCILFIFGHKTPLKTFLETSYEYTKHNWTLAHNYIMLNFKVKLLTFVINICSYNFVINCN